MYMPVLILIQSMRKLNDSNDYYIKCVWEEWVWNLAVISLNLKIIIIVTDWESTIPSHVASLPYMLHATATWLAIMQSQQYIMMSFGAAVQIGVSVSVITISW